MSRTFTLPPHFQWDYVGHGASCLMRTNGVARKCFGYIRKTAAGKFDGQCGDDASTLKEFDTTGAAARYVEDYAAREEKAQ